MAPICKRIAPSLDDQYDELLLYIQHNRPTYRCRYGHAIYLQRGDVFPSMNVRQTVRMLAADLNIHGLAIQLFRRS